GADYAMQVLTNSGFVYQAAALGYDPDAGAWNGTPASPSLPTSLNVYDNLPSASADFAALGSAVYFRGTATDWTTVFASAQPITQWPKLSPDFDSQSLVNQGPNFMSYAVIPQSGTQGTVQSIVLQNGVVLGGAAIPFSAEKMFTVALEGPPAPGMSPQGPNLFVTYPATDASFDSASAINLHQYAGAAVAGQIQHYPIYQLSVQDHFQGPAVTTYCPDPSTAACDPTGMVVKYYQTTVYPGSSDTSRTPYGKSVNNYLNAHGITSGNYYDMLDGLLLETAVYDGVGKL